MYTGTIIDELIATVERAEVQARAGQAARPETGEQVYAALPYEYQPAEVFAGVA